MRTHATSATGQAQHFDITETFFSTTDPRGVITAGNAVFSRTSGYPLDELRGQPHNLIRHPEMPRIAFRLLWETVRAGKTFMGYVKNQARNGNHYWVFAVVVPVPNGYLSVRIKPTSPRLPQIEALYRKLVEAEAAATAGGATESQAAEAGRAALQVALQPLGFATYESFSQDALNTEIKARDAEIARRALRLFPAEIGDDSGSGIHHLLTALYGQTLAVYREINAMFASLDAFVAVSRGIGERKEAVRVIAEDFRLNALNAQIAAQPLGVDGLTLGTVAQILNRHGQSLSTNVGALAESILHTTTAITDIASNLSAARIQVEMLLTYVAEIAAVQQSRANLHELRAITQDLGAGFITTIERAFRAVEALRRGLPEVLAAKELLRKDIVFLHVAQISGLTEVSRLRDAHGLHTTFTGLRAEIDTGGRELARLDEVVDQLKALTADTPHAVTNIEQSMQRMRETLALANTRTATRSFDENRRDAADAPPSAGQAAEETQAPIPFFRHSQKAPADGVLTGSGM